jgi:hypothetical protein
MVHWHAWAVGRQLILFFSYSENNSMSKQQYEYVHHKISNTNNIMLRYKPCSSLTTSGGKRQKKKKTSQLNTIKNDMDNKLLLEWGSGSPS